MNPSNVLLEKCKQFEGLKLSAYKCPAGVWTIGYGHTQGVKQGQRITASEASTFLMSDLRNAGNQVERLLPFLTQNQYDALTDFVYNLGIGNLRSSTLLKYIRENKSDKEISLQFMRWVKAGGKVLPGLVKRREWEAERWCGKV